MGLNFLREFCNLATVLGNNAARVFDWKDRRARAIYDSEQKQLTYGDNMTEWGAIQAVMVQLIDKFDDRESEFHLLQTVGIFTYL